MSSGHTSARSITGRLDCEFEGWAVWELQQLQRVEVAIKANLKLPRCIFMLLELFINNFHIREG